MSAQRLFLLGTGGNAADVLDIVDAINAAAGSPVWEVAGAFDDDRAEGEAFYAIPVMGPIAAARATAEGSFINTIGSDASFRRRPAVVSAAGVDAGRYATLVHPGAAVSPRARLGRGVYVHFGACVGGGVAVGDYVSIAAGCLVGHDTVVGEHTVLAPGATVGGFCDVGRCCYVGARATVRQRLRVGEGALVGMGANVIRDVAAHAVVVGNPAQRLRCDDG
jgi:sugar O-acyltransferase (sialic acid O-acetyltransferase NeuD family)